MPSTVYFIDLRATYQKIPGAQVGRTHRGRWGWPPRSSPAGSPPSSCISAKKGNTAFIRPVFVRRFVEAVKAAGGHPFLTDANTLYVGTRSDAPGHLITATENGFAYSVVGAPLVIADGLRGHSTVAVPVDLPECKEAWIGAEVVQADSLVSLSHFKGHDTGRFRSGAIRTWAWARPAAGASCSCTATSPLPFDPKRCISCGRCIERCPVGAIKFVRRGPDEPAPQGHQEPRGKGQQRPGKVHRLR